MIKLFRRPMGFGLAAHDVASIECAVKPTESQCAAFDELKAITVKTEEMVRTACPDEPPPTSLAQLEMVGKRLGAILETVCMLRPAINGFYKTLSNEGMDVESPGFQKHSTTGSR